MELRDYEIEVVDKVRTAFKSRSRVILQAETGSGKGVMAAYLLKLCMDKGKRGLFIARGRELVLQASRNLDAFSVPHGIIMRGNNLDTDKPVQVVSKDTLASWCLPREDARPTILAMPQADLVICDECHCSMAPGWFKILTYYKPQCLLGLTATPAREDGRPLGDFWESLVMAVPPSKLIKDGWIVPCKVFAPRCPSLKGVKVKGNDWDLEEVGRRYNKVEMIGDLLEHWQRLAENRQTVVYAVDRAHGQAVHKLFLDAGVDAAYLDGLTPIDERDDILQRFQAHKLKLIVNIMVLKEGVDLPCLECIVIARPTRKYVLYRQIIGRSKRPYIRPDGTEKEFALILDHAGAVHYHGFPDEDVPWVLDKGNINKITRDRLKHSQVAQPITCPHCWAVFSARADICPHCGHKLRKKKPPRSRQHKPGLLFEVNGQPNTKHQDDLQRWWHRCLAIMAYKGRSFGAAAHMFFDKFRTWPWEHKLKNLPAAGPDWRKLVRDVYPQYIRS